MPKKMNVDSDSYVGESGRWEKDAIGIPKGEFMACLHVKRDGAATGSIGKLNF